MCAGKVRAGVVILITKKGKMAAAPSTNGNKNVNIIVVIIIIIIIIYGRLGF